MQGVSPTFRSIYKLGECEGLTTLYPPWCLWGSALTKEKTAGLDGAATTPEKKDPGSSWIVWIPDQVGDKCQG